jgi:hypothetical protein
VEEETAMNKIRMIGLSAMAVLVVLGTGWSIEKSSHAQDRPAISAPANASEAATTPALREPADVQPAAVYPDQEYDRSDLLLSQG